jgi:hypothetical protein
MVVSVDSLQRVKMRRTQSHGSGVWFPLAAPHGPLYSFWRADQERRRRRTIHRRLTQGGGGCAYADKYIGEAALPVGWSIGTNGSVPVMVIHYAS